MKALIFDFDGVIVDSELYWPEYERKSIENVVSTWTDRDQEKIVGMNFPTVFQYLVQNHGLKISLEAFEAQAELIADKVYEATQLIDGFTDFYEKARRQYASIGIATSSRHKWIDPVMERLGIQNWFDAITTCDHVDLHKAKPDPLIYLLTAEKLGVDPKQCIAIEDSKNGLQSANDAGMFTIGITNGLDHGQDLSAANLIVDTFEEIDLQTLI